MNINGPRNFNPNMKADLAKQVKDLAKLDEGKALGEAQQANTDRPEGETEVNKTIIVTRDKNGNTTYVYDGYDNGYIVSDGKRMYDPDMHSILRDYVEKYGDGNTAPGGLK